MTLFDFETDMWLIGRQNMGLSTTERWKTQLRKWKYAAMEISTSFDGEVSIVAAMEISTSLKALTERSPLMQQCESPRHLTH
jgi:hypothetical protein